MFIGIPLFLCLQIDTSPETEDDRSTGGSTDISLLLSYSRMQRSGSSSSTSTSREEYPTGPSTGLPDAECLPVLVSPTPRKEPSTSSRPPNPKRRILGAAPTSKPDKPDFEDVAVGFIQQLKESRSQKSHNPHMNYAATVADRLSQITSAKQVAVLKHKIDNLLHEAIMEEMADN